MKSVRSLLPLLFITSFAAFLPSLRAELPKVAPALQPFVDDHTIPGAVVLVANKEKILDLEAVGYADLAAKKPMQPDSLFWLASMTKPITCTLLMMLVDDGKVNVDDPVTKYLPEFKGQLLAVKEAGNQQLRGPGGAIQGYVINDSKVDAGDSSLKKPDHTMRVRDLLTHRPLLRMSPVCVEVICRTGQRPRKSHDTPQGLKARVISLHARRIETGFQPSSICIRLPGAAPQAGLRPRRWRSREAPINTLNPP